MCVPGASIRSRHNARAGQARALMKGRCRVRACFHTDIPLHGRAGRACGLRDGAGAWSVQDAEGAGAGRTGSPSLRAVSRSDAAPGRRVGARHLVTCVVGRARMVQRRRCAGRHPAPRALRRFAARAPRARPSVPLAVPSNPFKKMSQRVDADRVIIVVDQRRTEHSGVRRVARIASQCVRFPVMRSGRSAPGPVARQRSGTARCQWRRASALPCDRLKAAMHAWDGSANHHFADLHDRGQVGVVGDVAQDLRRMRPEAGIEGFLRRAKDVAHR